MLIDCIDGEITDMQTEADDNYSIDFKQEAEAYIKRLRVIAKKLK
jgi:hypothetical protein